MRKMLIVDDEEYITNALYYFFMEKKGNELEIFKAYSAFEAVALFDKIRFDLVLSDICMPGMDGIQLMKNLKSRWPSCRLIFFTGHKDFDYTYEALQYSMVSYVLKTEGYDKILMVVEKALDDISRQYSRTELTHGWSENKENTYHFFAREYAKKLLMDIECNIPKDWTSYSPLLESYISAIRVSELEEAEEICQYIENTVLADSVEGNIKFLTYVQEQKIWFVLQFEENSLIRPSPWLLQTMGQVQECISEYFRSGTLVVVNDQPTAHGNLSKIREKIEKCFRFSCQDESGIVLVENSVEPKEVERNIQKLIAYIEQHYHEDISLTTMAEFMHFNPSYLSWLFKKNTGINLQKYLSELRIKHACKSLEESNKKITQISKEVGFGSSKYFIEVFKKEKHMTPQEWRSTH